MRPREIVAPAAVSSDSVVGPPANPARNGRAGSTKRICLHQGAMRDGPGLRASSLRRRQRSKTASHASTLKHDDLCTMYTREKIRDAVAGHAHVRGPVGAPSGRSDGNVHGLPMLGILRTDSARRRLHMVELNPRGDPCSLVLAR